MKQVLLLFCLTNILLSEDVTQEDNVFVLTDDNFKDFVSQNEFVFVKFYAPWCGHCKKMAPDYAKLGEKVHGESENIKIAKLDATVHKNASSEHGVQGFPTLKFFINGSPVDYQGARDLDAIYNWIQKKTGPASKALTTEEEYNLHSGLKLSVLLLLPEEDEEMMKTYMGLAATYDDVPFAHSTNPDHAQKLEISQKYGFVVFRSFDEGHKFLLDDQPLTTKAMKDFLEEHRHPFVVDFDQDAANRIFGKQQNALILLTDDEDSQDITTFREFAKENTGEDLVFSLSKVTSGFGQRLAEYIGVKTGPTARFVSFTGRNLNKFVVEDLTTEGLTQALADFKAGKLTAHYKSAAKPETNDEPVKVIVGDTFEELVLNDKYVLLEAYAPWCGHCKKLAPIYEDLAKKLENEADIVIAKMDATENEHPLMPVTGFPTLKLFKPNSETPVDYSGDRSLKDLVQFLEKETGRTFDGVKTDEL